MRGQKQRTSPSPARAEIIAPNGSGTYQVPIRHPGSGGENVIVEVVTPIALVDNAFGRLSSPQRPLGDAAANVE